MSKQECVLVTGGTGLLGTELIKLLKENGYETLVLSRQKTADPNTYQWNVKAQEIEPEALDRADHIIHLAGAGIADKRWTDKRKKEIIDSRVDSANLLFNTLKQENIALKTFLSASAIGYYGDRGADWITEEEPPGDDFLAQVCVKWEEVSRQFEKLGIRTAQGRIGLLLSLKAGMLKETYQPLKFGLAPYFADGSQYYSWVHIQDVANAFIHLLKNDELSGPFNMAGQQPVTNKQFVKTLKQVSGKPAIPFSVPAFGLRLVFGEMANALLNGSKISSEKLQASGFRPAFSDLSSALKDLLPANR